MLGAWDGGYPPDAIIDVIDAAKGEQCGGRSYWWSAGLHGGQSKYQRGEDGGFCFLSAFPCQLYQQIVGIDFVVVLLFVLTFLPMWMK